MPTERKLITTRQLAALRGVSRQAIAAAVKRGAITPALVLDNGNYLFTLDGQGGGDEA